MSKLHLWEWVPLISVGGLRFDEPLPEDLGTLRLQRTKHRPGEIVGGLIVFEEVGGETDVYLNEDKIESVFCYDNFYFKGRDLMGLSAEKVMDAIGGAWDLDDEDEDEREFSEDNLGITIVEEGGIVATIIVHGFIEGD